MDEPLQKSLERYDVLDRIAVGGMAEVFLAKAYGAHGFEKTLAIKRILPELARDPEFEARFIAEAKVAVRLSHANVVQVFDFGRIGESLFIAMEYVDGLDLAAMLRKFKDEGRQVPLPAAFHIAIEIVRALDFAHGHNVVHRDVSPSNILISRAGEVKIADFGIAVAAQPHRGGGPGPRKVMGKWRYMSPEQTRGDTLDTRSDLFSAASVIFELFTGEKLFPGDEAEDIAKNIETMPIPKMTSLRAGLPSRLDDVLGGALARKPIDRPTRPATVLRSLIELSYESSIMATALDVAEALATVIPAKRTSGRGALDDVIRKQLADQPTAQRRTAVTDGKPPSTETAGGDVSTGLFRKIGRDGLSQLEIVDQTAIRSPRAKRNSEQGELVPGDTDLHKLYEATHDRDRHTEVGGPPTGEVPKLPIAEGTPSEPLPPKTGTGRSVVGDAPPTRTGNARWIVLALLLVGAGGTGLYALTRDRGASDIVAPPAADAAVVVDQRGSLTLDPDHDGATGFIEVIGDPSTRQAIAAVSAARPFSVKVPANTKIHVHLELAGFQPYDDTVTASPGEGLRVRVRFEAAPARLHAVTDPPGVQVSLGGRILGETPRTFENLAPTADAVLVLSRAGFQPITKKVTLEAGKTLEIDETLKAEQKFGYVQIRVTGAAAWGEVFFKGAPLGRNASASALNKFKLPVGKQQLRIFNPIANKETLVTVDVSEKATPLIDVSLD